MNEETLAAQNERAEFEARNSPAGRLLRYCKGRIDGMFPRLAVTASGALTLWLLHGPAVGLAVGGVVLAGEALDCLVLWLIARRSRTAPPGPGAFAASSWSAAIQALTIAASVATAWMLAPENDGRYFAMAYLAGAALNAGIVLPFHARAAKVRLNIYLATLMVLFGADVVLERGSLRGFLQDGFATVIFIYMIKIFLDFTNKGFERRIEMERDLLGQKHRVQQANEDLEEKERESRRLALVAKHANDAIVIRGADGRIEWVNDTFTRMTGYRPEEAIGKTPASLLNGPDSSAETTAMIDRAVREQRSIVARILNYRKDGSTLWVETSLTPIVEPDGSTSMIIGLERDISDTIARENELAQARAEAEDGARAKTEFLATMSHEIRTPMNGIIGMADLLGKTDLDKDQQMFVSTILASGETLLQIINDILDVTKIEAGKLHILREPFSIAACLEDVMRLLDTLAAGKGITLDLEWTSDPPEVLIGDPGRITQVILNLVGNAIKFTEAGGVKVRASVRPDGGRQQAVIEICDTGIGISSDRLDRIFDSFAQAEMDTTRRFGGTGLGLTIARMLVCAMGGDISVTSTPGKGSCFTVTLALEMAGASVRLPRKETVQTPACDLGGARILVAEDNRTNRLVVRKMLSDANVRLIFAGDGEQAVGAYRDQRPDLIFMDLSMPGKDGIEATREIRDHERERNLKPVPIIALTANGFESDRRKCLEVGMDDFLTKPVKKAGLLESAARYLKAG